LCLSKPRYVYRLAEGRIENSPVEKDLEVLIDEKCDMSKQCAVGAQKPNCISGYIKRRVVSRARKVIVFLYSVLTRPHLEY